MGSAAGVLLVLAGLGAALVHVIEYHLGLGTVGGRSASIAFMLAHCPARGALLAIAIAATLTTLALLGGLRLLLRTQRRYTLQARAAGLDIPSMQVRPSPHPGRLVVLYPPLLLCQAGLYALAEHCLPMTVSTRMHGVVMDMAMRGALPLAPVHLVVALLLALLVWRLEHRFTVLHAVISTLRRLLRQAVLAPHHVHYPVAPPCTPLSRSCGPGALSRPPPV